jgi:hypothetical protein
MKAWSGAAVVALGVVTVVIGYGDLSYLQSREQSWPWVQQGSHLDRIGVAALVEPEEPARRGQIAEPERTEVAPPVVVTLPAHRARKAWLHDTGPAPTFGFALTRELQRELKRVGCFTGEIDGTWTSAVRSAAKTFTDRVNAALPSDRPDPVLLSLLQGHHGNACGEACPARESPGSDGRCLPSAMLVKVPAKAHERVPAGAAMLNARPSPDVIAAPSSSLPPVATRTEPAVDPAAANGPGSNDEIAVPPAPAAPARTRQRAAKPPPAGNVWSLFRQFERSGS